MAKSNRKRHKLSEETNPSSVLDRISNLPDSILSHILSFLPTKQAVATSILAKRWTLLWTEVTNLDFDTHDYTKAAEKTRFSDAVNQVLVLHKARTIDAFRLCDSLYSFKCSDPYINVWIHNAVSRDVNVLELSRHDYDRPTPIFNLPLCVLSCKTLVVLKLRGSGISISIAADWRVCLPNLKKLKLQCIHYENDESLPRLISGCPVLEDLTIFGGKIRGRKIASPTLRRLSIRSMCTLGVYDDDRRDLRVEIDAPALRNFELCADGSWHFSERTKDFEACIERLLIYSLSFVDRLHKVSSLHLSTHPIRLYNSPPNETQFTITQKFHNLRKLFLNRCPIELLFKLLELADDLQILVIEVVTGFSMDGNNQQQLPKCLLSSLRTIEVRDYPDQFDFEMVRYFLLNAKVLKRMDIILLGAKEGKFDILQKISMFPRGSTECELHFC